MAVRRNFKDTLFCDLFGSEERKGNALELYNALADTSHDDPDELELTTIGDAVFLGRKNDVSFLVGDDLVMWEHQSTPNPNMPVRGLLYFARLYTAIIERRKVDLYDKDPVRLPSPRFFVLYFGDEDRPEREELTLNSLLAGGPGDVEITATVLNCNEGRNAAIMDACEALRGYAHLLALIRANHESEIPLEQSVACAANDCIAQNVLADYLLAHRSEVIDMLFTIEDEERAMRVHWENLERKATARGLERGMAQGLEQGLAQGAESATSANLRSVMNATGLDAESAMDMLQIPADERAKYRTLLSNG